MDGINSRIQEIVKFSNLTKTAFGEKIGLGQSMISRLCGGTARPSDRTIGDMCRVFGINEHWLRTGEGEMCNPPNEDTDAVIEILEDKNHPLRRLILGFMRTYNELGPKEREVVNCFIRNLCESKGDPPEEDSLHPEISAKPNE